MRVNEILSEIEAATARIEELKKAHNLTLGARTVQATVSAANQWLLHIDGRSIAHGSAELQALADFMADMFGIVGNRKEEQ